jgi:valyl-tRNA synthetase
LVNLFEAALRLLHPVMPFITEEIWQATFDGNPPQKSIALASFPQADEELIDTGAETDMAILQDLIVAVRNLRAELKVEPKTKVPTELFVSDAAIRAMIEQNQGAVERLGHVESIVYMQRPSGGQGAVRSTSRFDVHVIYEKKIDVAAECDRLKKELEKMDKEYGNNQRQVSNEQFLSKAPANVVEGLRSRAAELTVLIDKTKSKLKELDCK